MHTCIYTDTYVREVAGVYIRTYMQTHIYAHYTYIYMFIYTHMYIQYIHKL